MKCTLILIFFSSCFLALDLNAGKGHQVKPNDKIAQRLNLVISKAAIADQKDFYTLTIKVNATEQEIDIASVQLNVSKELSIPIQFSKKDKSDLTTATFRISKSLLEKSKLTIRYDIPKSKGKLLCPPTYHVDLSKLPDTES